MIVEVFRLKPEGDRWVNDPDSPVARLEVEPEGTTSQDFDPLRARLVQEMFDAPALQLGEGGAARRMERLTPEWWEYRRRELEGMGMGVHVHT